MQLFALTVDFTFKALFGKNPDLLLALLNSFPQFTGESAIHSLVVLNPEIPKELSDEKLSILDIKAEDVSGNQFLIEMQAFGQSNFPKRALYYWAKIYSRSLSKGNQYTKLKKVYSFNFLNFTLWKKEKKIISTFHLLEKDRNFKLTEDLEINIIELPKFLNSFQELKTDLDYWIYLLKKSESLEGEDMSTLQKKNPKIKKAITELKTMSLSQRNREIYESRRKAELDYNSGISSAYEEGWEKGIEKGIVKGIEKGIEKGRKLGIDEGLEKGKLEGLCLGIQLNLESRFNSKGLALMPLVRKIKDLDRLQKILEASVKSKTIDSIKKLFK